MSPGLHEVVSVAKQLPTHLPPPTALTLCARCHTAAAAPPIPFQDPCELAKWLHSPRAENGHSAPFADVISRIDSGDMPQGTQLPETEKSELKNSLSSLRECPHP